MYVVQVEMITVILVRTTSTTRVQVHMYRVVQCTIIYTHDFEK